jgi:hypothetical protein
VSDGGERAGIEYKRGTGRKKGRDAGRGGTTEQDDVPLLKCLHIAEDVRQYEIKQRPQLCEVVL